MLVPLALLAALLTAAPVPIDKVQLEPATAEQVLAAVKSSGAKVTVVNVWATWCIPCREEFPDLVRLGRAYDAKGVKMLFVSSDFASDTRPAKEFLAEQGVDDRTYLKAQKDEAFIDGLDPAWSGALPATFVFDATGRLRHSFTNAVTYEALERQIQPLLAEKN